MKLIHYIRNLPIRRKLTVLLLLPCVVILLLAGAALLAFQFRLFRYDFARDMTAVASIVGENSIAAVTFNDAKSATQVLNSLKAKPLIVSAILILPDGSVFAQYGNHPGAPLIEPEARFLFRDKDALMIQPLLLEGKQVATLNVVSDYRVVYAGLFKLVGWMLFVVTVVGTGIAVMISSRLQRIISDPVLRLARTAQTVADNKDYSVRAREESTAELAILTRTFNQMLTRIQEQDEVITLSRHKLEALINSIDGIVWECTPDTCQFTFVSRQSERLLGYSPQAWTANAEFWRSKLHPEDAPRAMQAYHTAVANRRPYHLEYRLIAADGRTVWIRESGMVMVHNDEPAAVRGIWLDISTQKAAAAELDDLHRRLLETSRNAGMAEVATGVLHNVGNVLNSVSVSAQLVTDCLRRSKIPNLSRAVALLREQDSHLAEFLTTDPKGRLLPDYLSKVTDVLATEQAEFAKEIASMGQHVEHIKEIVAMQQSYAKVSGTRENLSAVELVEDALRMNAGPFERHRIQVEREYDDKTPTVCVDRHKVLQILINLLRNAKYAMDQHDVPGRRLVIRIGSASPTRVKVVVCDNGIGIAPENLVKIFSHGFTTRKDGHGFGLHSGANAAKEMGGSLDVQSDGLGQGATFTLVLPVAASTRQEASVSNPG